MKTVCGTGHRPNKLGGYDNQVLIRLIDLATALLVEQHPDRVISGVALGWDTAIAIAAIRLNIPLTCAVPFRGQERMWTAQSRERYHKILSKADVVVYVSEGEYSARAMQVRNEWMVDNSDVVLALWDGTTGGTANCIAYAQKKHALIINSYDRWTKMVVVPDNYY